MIKASLVFAAKAFENDQALSHEPDICINSPERWIQLNFPAMKFVCASPDWPSCFALLAWPVGKANELHAASAAAASGG